MKLKEIKKIYNYDEQNKVFVIDVELEDYRDAYSDWDFSPFANRDLDDDLTEYLLECSYEIPLKQPMVINFHLMDQAVNPVREAKSIQGMFNYFDYERRKLKNYRMRVIRDTITFFVIGTVLLILGAFLDEILTASIVKKVVSEGFSIGGWVMIWEMFSAWFFDINKVTHKIKHFIKLRDSKINYIKT